MIYINMLHAYNNTALICLHGFGENAGVYEHFINQIKHIIPNSQAIDLPGHGTMNTIFRCTTEKQYKYFKDAPEYVLTQHLESIQEDNIILVGTSYGGIVSYILANMYANAQILCNKNLAIIINDVPYQLPYRLKRGLCKELINMYDQTFTYESFDAHCQANGFKKDRQPISEDVWQKYFVEKMINEYGKIHYSKEFFEDILNHPETYAPSSVHTIKNGADINDVDQWYLDLSPLSTPTLLLIGANSAFFKDEDKINIHQNDNLKQHIVVPQAHHFIDLSSDMIIHHMKSFIDTFINMTSQKSIINMTSQKSKIIKRVSEI